MTPEAHAALNEALAAAPDGLELIPVNRIAAAPLTPHVLQLVEPLRAYSGETIRNYIHGWQLHLPYERDPMPMNGRVNRFKHASSVRTVRETANWLATQIPRQERIRVELVQHVTDRKDRDPDNLAHTYKALIDGLRDDKRRGQTGIVADDTPAYVDRLMPRIEPHKLPGLQRELLLSGWMRLHVWPAT